MTTQDSVWSFSLKRVLDVRTVPQEAQISRALQCGVRLCKVSKEKYIKLVGLVGRHDILYGCRDLGYRRQDKIDLVRKSVRK